MQFKKLGLATFLGGGGGVANFGRSILSRGRCTYVAKKKTFANKSG